MLKDCLSTSIFLFNCYLCLGTLHVGVEFPVSPMSVSRWQVVRRVG